jgi:aerobic C4-dicarboxylate transport protein
MQRLHQGLDNPTFQESQEPEAILDLKVEHMAVTPAKA